MAVYMVERSLPGIGMDALGDAQKKAIETGARMRSAGTDVRYIRTTFAPDDGRCMCLFEAVDEAAVRRLNEDAGIPFNRIVPAMDLTP